MLDGVNNNFKGSENYNKLLNEINNLDALDGKADSILSKENAQKLCKQYNIDLSTLSVFFLKRREGYSENSQIFAGYFSTDQGDYVVSLDGTISQSHEDEAYHDSPAYYDSRKDDIKEVKNNIYVGAIINAIVQANPFKYGFGNKK